MAREPTIQSHEAKPAQGVSPPRRGTLYHNAIKQFDKAAALMGLDPNIRKMLAKPRNEMVVYFPVKMDDGRIEMFTGYRTSAANSGIWKRSAPSFPRRSRAVTGCRTAAYIVALSRLETVYKERGISP